MAYTIIRRSISEYDNVGQFLCFDDLAALVVVLFDRRRGLCLSNSFSLVSQPCVGGVIDIIVRRLVFPFLNVAVCCKMTLLPTLFNCRFKIFCLLSPTIIASYTR